MDMMDLENLLPVATGPDAGIDGFLWHVGTGLDTSWASPYQHERCFGYWDKDDKGTTRCYPVPRLTASLDAAHAFKERLLPGHACLVGDMAFKDCSQLPYACIWTPDGEPKWRAEAKTMPLALCLAVFRAIQPLT